MNTIRRSIIITITLLFTIIVGFHSSGNNLYGDQVVESMLFSGKDGHPLSTIREGVRDSPPDFVFHTLPLGIMGSYYDYFPGSFDSIPIRMQPSPAGIHSGGGIYLVFQAITMIDGSKRLYYVYLENGMITTGPSLLYHDGISAEGFSGIDIDMETGDPFVAFQHLNLDEPDCCQISLTYDAYDLIGVPGVWYTPYGVIYNPLSIGDLIDQEFVYPAVHIGPSPQANQQRIYIVAKNMEDFDVNFPHGNVIIAYADFSHPSDLNGFDEDQWTYVTIPQLDDWPQITNTRSFRSSITSRHSGHIAIVGHTVDSVSSDPYDLHNFVFVLENDNYGEGDWTVFTADVSIPVGNPDDYFVGPDNNPFEDMRYTPIYSRRHNTIIDEQNNYHFLAMFILTTEEYSWFPDMTTIKHIKFERASEEFIITDLFPRNADGSLYLPWSIPPEYDDQGDLIINPSYPVYWWNTEDLINENYHRIIQDGPRIVALFQGSLRARLYNEFGDDEYQVWANVPETYIMISNDYGAIWSDPICLNSIETPEFDGLIPVYWYLADHLEDLGNNWFRIHLAFYSQNDYGSYIIGNGPNTGGNVMYTSLDIDFSGLDSDQNHIISGKTTVLKQNYPNPFNPETIIEFFLSDNTKTRLDIYNVKGQRVKTLLDDYLRAGSHSLVWKGKDERGRNMPSGIYFYRLTTKKDILTNKMLLLK